MQTNLLQELAEACPRPATDLLFTTNPGLEDVVGEEFCALAGSCGLPEPVVETKPFGLGGHVLAACPEAGADVEPVFRQMRSVHHVLQPLYSFQLTADDPIQTIYGQLLEREIPGLRTARSFRVTTRRTGEHSFTSLDVQRMAGAALIERHGCAVDLKSFELEVRVDVYDATCLVSLQQTRVALSKRYRRAYQPRAALKATVAYALLHLARLEEWDGALLDPFCGSGTILMEAAQALPRLRLFGSDLNADAVDGARQNAETAGLADRLHLRQADARELSAAYPDEKFSAIVTNPPYGVRVGQHMDFPRLYRLFLEEAYRVLEPGGVLVVLVWKRGVFTRVLRQLDGFARRHVRAVETGGLYPRIFVLQRR